MNHIEPEEQRDLEPRLTRRDPLQLSRVIGPEDSEERSDSAGSNQRLTSFGRARTIPGANAWQLIELSDFFLQSHQTKNRVGELRRSRRCQWRLARYLSINRPGCCCDNEGNAEWDGFQF